MKKHIVLILFSILSMQSKNIVCFHESAPEPAPIESAPAKKAQKSAQQRAQPAEIAQLQEAFNQRALNDAIAMRNGKAPEKAAAPAETAIHSQSFSSFVAPSRRIQVAVKPLEASTARPKVSIPDSPRKPAPKTHSPTSETSIATQDLQDLSLSSPSFGYPEYGFTSDFSRSTSSRKPDTSTGISLIDSTAYKSTKPEDSPFNREISLEPETAQPEPAPQKPETFFSRLKNPFTSKPKFVAAENFSEHYKTLSYKDFAQTYAEKGEPYLYEILGLKNKSSNAEVIAKCKEIDKKNPKLSSELKGILNATESALIDGKKIPTNGEYQLHKYDNSKPISRDGFQTVSL